MDDFEYSVQISELDWDAFFHACEECNMLPPGLAGLEDSGMSDIEDMASQQIQNATQTTSYEPTLRTGGSPHGEGSPVERYLSKYGLSSPDQVLSGSEDDFQLEAINVFFERLKSVSATADHKDLRSKMVGLSAGSDVEKDSKEIAASGAISRLCRKQRAQSNDCHTYTFSDSADDDQENHMPTCPDTELCIKEETWSLDVLKEGDKWEAMMRTQPDTERSQCNNLVNGKEARDANQVKEAKTQLEPSNNSDLLVVQGQAFNVTPRRRRKKKKRASAEITEMDSEYQADPPRKVSDFDEETCGRRGDVFQETCGSELVSEAPGESENFTVFHPSASVKDDTMWSTLVSLSSQEELSWSAVKGSQSKTGFNRMSDGYLTEKPAESGQPAMREDLKLPQPDLSDNHHTKGDNERNHLQPNTNLPSGMPVTIASSEVSKAERHLVSINDFKSQRDHEDLQLLHTLVCSQTPKSQFEDRVMLPDFQFDEASARHQRKTSSSCVTLPELTNNTRFSATCENTEMKNSASVTGDNLSHKHSDDWPVEGSMSEPFLCKLSPLADQAQQKQETLVQIPKADEITDAPLSQPENSGISNKSLNSHNRDGPENTSLSSPLNNAPESQQDINIEAVEIMSPVDKNEDLNFKEETKKQPQIHTTDPDSQLSAYSKCDPTLSNEELKGSVLNVDESPCCSSEDRDLSSSIAVQGSLPTSPGSTAGAKSLEMLDPGPVNQPAPPIYAISSFWNEMEKLTINDILRLRLVGQSQHPCVLLQPDDGNITEVPDVADSGYLTHLRKPDRSSGDMGIMSDPDVELAELPIPDAAKLVKGTSESPKPTGIIWESDPNLSVPSTGMEDVFNLDKDPPLSLFRNNSNHCFRKMCETVSVQNLQTLESQNLGKMIRNASLHSIPSVYSAHSDAEDDYVDPFDRVETSSPVYLSDEEEMDSSGISFSEIFEYLFGMDEPRQSVSEANTVADTHLSGTETSVPEMYEHFFSEFEPESLFYPLTEDNTGTDDELVPIFSSSRSATRNVQFPEVYDYFFPDDSPVHSDEDEEPEHTVIRVVTRYDHNQTRNHDSVSASDPYKHLFHEKENSWNFVWRNPFSFRRVRHTGGRVPCEESSSQDLTLVTNSTRTFHGGIQPINILGADQSPFPDPLIFNLENRIFRKLAEQQMVCSEMHAAAVADPRLDAPLLPIRQADMCLVCIAFASWVLKSVNTQGADTWKAVLLANISALSAIRYLRKFTRDEAAKISPLRQIKPD